MEPALKVPLDDRGKRSTSLRGDLIKAFKANNTEKASGVQTTSPLNIPTYMMNFPITVDNDIRNNALMKDNKPYDYNKAFKQFMGLYNLIAKEALVFILPSEEQLQDLPFVANIGCYLPHLKTDTIIVSNFKSPPRKGEDKVGGKFFESLGYVIDKPTTHWEGEADLKWIKDNLYIGGYGIRTDKQTYGWMANKFDMNIISIEMTDKKLYHFDCQFFPITSEKALVATAAFKPEDLKKIEKHLEIINVPKEFMYDGWTNCVRLRNKILCGKTNKKSDSASDALFEKHGYETIGVDLNEFVKSGADLSCMVMHFNYAGRD